MKTNMKYNNLVPLKEVTTILTVLWQMAIAYKQTWLTSIWCKISEGRLQEGCVSVFLSLNKMSSVLMEVYYGRQCLPDCHRGTFTTVTAGGLS